MDSLPPSQSELSRQEPNEAAIPTCAEMTELVTDYLEAELPLRTRLSARVHLLQCKACTAYYDQMRRTMRLLAKGEPRQPAPEVADLLLGKASSDRPAEP
jgi:predicted anti-sigma-YlaC factor YlaD